MSGWRVTVPVPVTVIVCSFAVGVGSTARAGAGLSEGRLVAARNRLTPIPAAIKRARRPGVGIVSVVDMVEVLLSDHRPGPAGLTR